jgi:hypothetical protein
MRVLAGLALTVIAWQASSFDHSYADYGRVLRDHVRLPRVAYTGLKADRGALDAAIAAFAQPGEAEERGWPREQRLAFWINAYNAFTLRAIVDHYPIRAGWLALPPRNSIRQIDGVWTTLAWSAAGRTVTLDDIEHRILRPEFKEPRVHFAINCASVGCPPLAAEPYRAAELDGQLDAAARRYLASPQGLRVEGTVLRVSRIFEWYGEDFAGRFAPDRTGRPDRVEQAILAVIAQFGPAAAATAARAPGARVRFLNYDWTLNDLQ